MAKLISRKQDVAGGMTRDATEFGRACSGFARCAVEDLSLSDCCKWARALVTRPARCEGQEQRAVDDRG